jgi:hypothetical protein
VLLKGHIRLRDRRKSGLSVVEELKPTGLSGRSEAIPARPALSRTAPRRAHLIVLSTAIAGVVCMECR